MAQAPPPALGVDAAEIAPLLAGLRQALDLDTPAGAEAILAGLAEKLPRGWLDDICRAVDGFDFPAAEAHTLALARRLGVDLVK